MQPIFRRLILVFILLGGAAWTWFTRPASSLPTATQPAPLADFPAPDFTLNTISGETIQLSSLRGQPVILNFWATWCPPCRAEMPALQEVYQEYQDRIIVLAVNATNQDDLLAIQTFAAESDLSLPILLDSDGGVQRLYEISSLPTTFFIDRSGTIQEVLLGGPIPEAGLRARITTLLEVLP